ncbi:sulfotransferase domain-containing protein [Halalkalibacter urbisdiaboli]|uniref:sulfotransferase domain-containing protein n=1 Tax=Halalkalibacter urbisdiaboli TaxID=1960589 RepID=UPI000B44C671|nr:sulfotransferase domain-containing protein [Halalkalibacter urbisdiaboli]
MEKTQPNSMPKILVNSVPKSGTHLLIQILLGIQGMKIAPSWVYEQNLDELIKFDSGTVTPAHLPYSKEVADRLNNLGIRTIFISRDLRDIAVSLYHFALENRFGKHPLHPILTKFQTDEERLMVVIKGYSSNGIKWPNILEFTQSRYGWLGASNVLCVTFEELMKNEQSREQALLKIVNYLWNDLKILRMSKDEIMEVMFNSIKPKESGTFRKGKIGSWKNEFSKQHKEAFKAIAGDFLIQLGYEENHNW